VKIESLSFPIYHIASLNNFNDIDSRLIGKNASTEAATERHDLLS
jgi:hypothetical protein